jgi:hypothetical protein
MAQLEIKSRMCPHCKERTKIFVLAGAHLLTAEEEEILKRNKVLRVQAGGTFKCSGCEQEIPATEENE